MLTLGVLIFTQFHSNSQEIKWYKINTAPFLFSNSPFESRTDCYGQTQIRIAPVNFEPFIVTDSAFISNDLKQIKLMIRHFGNFNQIDTNDLCNYSLIDSATYPLNFYNNPIRRIRYRKSNDSFYIFNFVLTNSQNYESDTVLLYRALKIQKEKCMDNFPFGNHRDCDRPLPFKTTQVGKSKPEPHPPDCYSYSLYHKFKNDGKQIELTVPIQNIALGTGWPYLELGDYLQTFDTSLNIFLKPTTGSFDPKKKQWVIEYDSDNTNTKGVISVYNGGTDTLFIKKCYTSAGNATIERFSEHIAPYTFGYINLAVLHKKNPEAPQNPSIWIEFLRKNAIDKKLSYVVPFRIQ